MAAYRGVVEPFWIADEFVHHNGLSLVGHSHFILHQTMFGLLVQIEVIVMLDQTLALNESDLITLAYPRMIVWPLRHFLHAFHQQDLLVLDQS